MGSWVVFAWTFFISFFWLTQMAHTNVVVSVVICSIAIFVGIVFSSLWHSFFRNNDGSIKKCHEDGVIPYLVLCVELLATISLAMLVRNILHVLKS